MKINQTKAALWIVCVNRAGYRRGAQLVEFMDDWAACVTAHGGSVGFEEYAQWSRRYSRATAYNRLKLFRDTFLKELGPDALPDVLMGPLLERLAGEVAEAER